jgi:hypothetical protein
VIPEAIGGSRLAATHGLDYFRAICGASSALVIACARDQPDEGLMRRGAPPAVAGCYALATRTDADALLRVRRFRLDLLPTSRKHPEIHPAKSLIDSARDYWSLWRADSLSDTVRISIGDAFTSTVVVVVPSSGGLRGRAKGIGEDRSEWGLGGVVYTKYPCTPDD